LQKLAIFRDFIAAKTCNCGQLIIISCSELILQYLPVDQGNQFICIGRKLM
jgi:hypothetical protein